MKKTILFFLLILISSISLYSQAKLSGTVIDENGPVPFARVILYDSIDTNIVSSYTNSDYYGNFAFDSIKSNPYRLVIKTPFHQQYSQQISKEELKNNQKIILISKSTMLQEVNIKASKIINENSRTIYLIDNKDQAKYKNGFDILSIINSINVNRLTKQITANNGGNVLLMINGKESNMNEINALDSRKISKIEELKLMDPRYMDKGIEKIINYIVEDYKGFSGSIGVKSAVREIVFDGYVELAYVYKKSKFSFSNYYNKRKYDRKKDLISYNYLIDTSFYNNEFEGKNNLLKYDDNNLMIRYDYNNKKLKLVSEYEKRYLWNHKTINSGDYKINNMQEINAFNDTVESAENSNKLSLYSEYKFSDKYLLYSDITFFKTKYFNKFSVDYKDFRNIQNVESNNSDLSSSIFFQNKINSKSTFKIGYTNMYSKLNQNEKISNKIANIISLQNDLYSSYYYKLNTNISLYTSLRLSNLYVENNNKNLSNENVMMNYVNTSYSYNNDLSFSLSYYRSPINPAISQFSDIALDILPNISYVPNNNIKSYYNNQVSLKTDYTKYLPLMVELQYNTAKKPTVIRYIQNDKTLYKQLNHIDKYEKYKIIWDLKIPIMEIAKLSYNGNYNNSNYKIDNSTENFHYFNHTFSFEAYLSKKIMFQAYYNLNNKDDDNLYFLTDNQGTGLSITYQKKNFVLNLLIYLPFDKRGEYYKNEYNFDNFDYTSERFIYNNSNMISIAFQYMFNNGKDINIKKKIEKSNSGSGLLSK